MLKSDLAYLLHKSSTPTVQVELSRVERELHLSDECSFVQQVNESWRIGNMHGVSACQTIYWSLASLHVPSRAVEAHRLVEEACLRSVERANPLGPGLKLVSICTISEKVWIHTVFVSKHGTVGNLFEPKIHLECGRNIVLIKCLSPSTQFACICNSGWLGLAWLGSVNVVSIRSIMWLSCQTRPGLRFLPKVSDELDLRRCNLSTCNSLRFERELMGARVGSGKKNRNKSTICHRSYPNRIKSTERS